MTGPTLGASDADHYVIRTFSDPQGIDAAQWNAMLENQPTATPFMRLEYLRALHDSGSACARTGWQAQFMTLWEDARIVAACPLYLKGHSYGEYVFDWAWADAYQRHGLDYYPKLLNAVPFTPVPGVRLLARDAQCRVALLRAIETLASHTNRSSVHVLFLDAADQLAARQAGWMLRTGVQFHWNNRAPMPYLDFEEYLASLQHDKRKKIRQERRRVNDAGVSLSLHEGSNITTQDWDFFHRCYTLTYSAHHSTPYLTRNFFARMADTMAKNWLLCVARRGPERIAASLIALDPEQRVAYGRYWGATEAVDCLHFEACYYQPLSWCIANGYRRFEGGAQGEHKMARGLLPVQTWSAHWLAHPQFASAVADFLARESEGVVHYLDELGERQPFRRAEAIE
ncbi:MAG: GNAT family N-acetyltransferase [Burkholderiaceae bacterium]